MEYNAISQIEFALPERNAFLFDEICRKTERLLGIEVNYVFSVIFVDSPKIHEINREYRGIDCATDVISFAYQDGEDPYDTEEDVLELGDIFINIDYVQKQAEEYGHSFDRELSFLFTHGLLHLLGYDHMNEADEQVMFGLQDEILHEIIER